MNQSDARLLVVEDEPKVASFLKSGLEENGYTVEIAPDGTSGVVLLLKTPFDLIILDVNLPGMNGIEFCSKIRNLGHDIPVLMLTALGTTSDKLSGFEAGADDYLVKPFEFTELMARIRALLKRTFSGKEKRNILNFMDLEMNLDTITVSRSGKKIDRDFRPRLIHTLPGFGYVLKTDFDES